MGRTYVFFVERRKYAAAIAAKSPECRWPVSVGVAGADGGSPLPRHYDADAGMRTCSGKREMPPKHKKYIGWGRGLLTLVYEYCVWVYEK